MRLYTIHQRPYWQVSETSAADQSVFLVREGFSWFALIVPLIWALWHRLWLLAGAFLLIGAFFNLVVFLLAIEEPYASILGGALLLWVGFEANDLRRWSLRRAGWHDLGIVSGRDRNEAEWRFFAAKRHQPNAV